MVGHYFLIYHMIRCSSSVGGWVLKWKLLWSGGCWCYFTTVYEDFLSVIALELLVNRKGSLLMCFVISLFIYLPPRHILYIHIVTFEATIDKQSPHAKMLFRPSKKN